MTALDMWAGIKTSHFIALDRQAQNETMENLQGVEQDEETQQKILHNVRNTQKITQKNKRSPLKANKKPNAASLRKSYSPPQPPRRSPNSKPVVSPAEKAHQEKIKKMKQINSRYSDMHKKMRKPEEESSSDGDSSVIPDIKIFDDVDLYNSTQDDKMGRARKIKRNEKQMASMSQMRRTDAKTLGSSRGGSWKMDDIFLGFAAADDADLFEGSVEEDQKTVKLNSGGK